VPAPACVGMYPDHREPSFAALTRDEGYQNPSRCCDHVRCPAVAGQCTTTCGRGCRARQKSMRDYRCTRAAARAFGIFAEIGEFAMFTAAEQRYIRRSLDVAELGADAAEQWARGIIEAANIGEQAKSYGAIAAVRSLLLTDLEPDDTSTVLPALIRLSAFDLQNGKLTSFAAYRFLYERLFGAAVRPWLLSGFTAAAMLPCIHPELRAELLRSLSDTDIRGAGWSSRETKFVPKWIEKVPVSVF